MITAAQMRAASALITDPDHWCRNDFARDAQGDGVRPTQHYARQWCAYGAIAKVMGISGEDAWDEVPNEYDLADTNNDQGHEAILNLMDKIADQLP